MGTINVRSNLTGKVYPILIAGNTPTASEDQFIRNYINQQDGGLIETPVEDTEEGSLIDVPKGIIGGFAKSFAQIPGGITSLGESVGQKLGFDVAPGESAIGKAAQDFSRGASESIDDYFDLNNSAYSKSGQAFGSLLSFLVPGTAVAKGASLAGAGAKAVAGLGFGTVATQGAAVQSQDQMNRIANFLEQGGVITPEQKGDAVILSGLVGTSEAIPFAALSKSLGAGLRILKKVDKKDRDKAIRTIGGRIKRALLVGTGEGLQEVGAGLAQDFIEQQIYNPDVEVGQSAYDDAVYGGGAGAALSLILDSIRGRQLKKFDQKQKQLDDDALAEGRENAEKLKNAEEYLKTQQDKDVKLLEGPTIDSSVPDVIIVPPTGNDQVDVQSQAVADSGVNQGRKRTQETLDAAREARTPYNPVKIESLPQDEASKIRQKRIQLKKGVPVDAPVPIQELEEVVGIEAADRERFAQKPILNKKPETFDEEIEAADIEAKEKDKIRNFTNKLLKQKNINTASTKKLFQQVYKTKIDNQGAEQLLNGYLSSGVLQYDGRGKYSPKQSVDINLDIIEQAKSLSQEAKQIRDTENSLRKEQENFVNDPIQFETYRQQIERLQQRYSDVQLEAFRLENKANKLSEGQQTIQARRIVPPLAPKRVFDEAPKVKETPEYKLKQKRVLDALRAELNRIGLSDVRLEGKPLIDEVQLTEDLARGTDVGITEGIQEVAPDGKRIIALAMELYDPNMTDAELQAKLGSVMNHEIIHALKSLNVFTDQEYATLEKAVKNRKYVSRIKGRDTQREYTYYDRAAYMFKPTGMPENEIIEEAIAEMYRDYADGKLKVAGKPKSLFDRILRFIKSIFSSHTSQGFTEVDQIFDNIGTTETEKQIGRRDRKPDDFAPRTSRSKITVTRKSVELSNPVTTVSDGKTSIHFTKDDIDGGFFRSTSDGSMILEPDGTENTSAFPSLRYADNRKEAIEKATRFLENQETKKSRIIIERLPNLHRGSVGPLPIAHQVKAKYLASIGMPNVRPDSYVQVNEDLARRIAKDFDEAKHDPGNPEVIKAYKAMADETFVQWKFIEETGIKIEFIKPDQANPYPKGSRDLLEDIRDNNHMWVFATDDGFGSESITQQDVDENPLLQKTGEIIEGRNVRYNDLFRIVHDYFGHALEGATFTARGEENAWQAHSRMYSPLAALAMTTETRGQNSWVNYSDKVGDLNRNSTNKAEETIYADQKITILSDFVQSEGLAKNIEGVTDERIIGADERLGETGDVTTDRRGVEGDGRRRAEVRGQTQQPEKGRKPELSPQRTVKLTHFSPIEGLQSIDPEQQRSNPNIRGDERRRIFPGFPARSYYAVNIEDPNGYNPEGGLGDNVYEIDVPFEGMYDWIKDERKFNSAANIELNRERPDLTTSADRVAYITTAKERMIKELGATGYFIDHPTRGIMAAMFYELKIPETYQAKKFDQAYKDSVNQKRGQYANRQMRSRVMAIGQEHTVSTRFPTAKQRVSDPSVELLFINGEVLKSDPVLAEKAANLIKGYNLSGNSKLYVNFSNDEIIEDHIQAMTNNILFVHDSIDPDIRERSSKWYDGARTIVDRLSKEYNYRPEVVAAVIASQSPQTDWFMNVSLAERVLDISRNHADKQFTPEMMKTALEIYGKPIFKPALDFISNPNRNSTSLDSLKHSVHKAMWIRVFDETYNDRGHRIITPEGEYLDYARKKDGSPKGTGWGSNKEISSAIEAMDASADQSLQQISISLGDRHKVRSFFNNMITPMSPEGHTTIDTHAVSVAFLKPLSGKSVEVDHNFGVYSVAGRSKIYGIIPSSSVSGVRGMYGLIQDAFTRAAEQRGILPRQMQSITWEAVRDLFPDTFKQQKQNVEKINSIWDTYVDGGLSIEDTRQEILNVTPAGFTEPSWARPSDTIPQFSGNASYERELSVSYVPGRFTRNDIGSGANVAGEPETRRSRVRATPQSEQQRQQEKNDRDIATAQLNIRYDNLSGLIAKGLKIIPEKLLFGRTRAEAAQRIVQKYQDSFQPVGAMMDELRDKGYTIADAMDPYLREVNSTGIIGSKISDLEETIVKPLIEEIRNIDISEAQLNNLQELSAKAAAKAQDEGYVKRALDVTVDPKMALVDAYLYAMHAKERNAQILQEYNRGLGSGMSNGEANVILDWFDGLDSKNQEIFRSVDRSVKRIVTSTNNIRYESGLVTKQEYDDNIARFKHYVPLRGDLDSTDEFNDDRLNKKRRTVNYFGALGKEDIKARGRGVKYAENILASTIAQNQRAIDRSERNKVGQDLVRLLRGQEEQSDGSFATNDNLRTDLKENFGEVTNVKEPLDPLQLTVKVDGEEVYVNFYRQSLARAFKHHYDPKTSHVIFQALSKLNRFLSNVNTSYNPAFVIPNFAKDLETALINIQQHDAEGITKEIVKDVAGAINGIRKVLRNQDDTSYWSQEYNKFVRAGGKNATNMMGTVQDQMDNLNKLLQDISDTTSLGVQRNNFFLKKGKSLLKFLEDYNTVIENGVRVATFTNLKKRGFTDARAAEAARNVTVNFAKGGEDKVFMNSLYLFYNASVQGSMAIFNAAYKSPKVRKLLGGLIVYGMLQDQLMAFFRDPDDEDEQNPYDQLSDYKLEHNLVFGTFGLTDEKFITIPLAYGLNMPFNLGRALSRYTRGEYTFGQMANSIFGTTMETLSPFGAIENFETYLVPTSVKPLGEMMINKNYRGDPIYKETPMYSSSTTPDAYTHWSNTGALSKFIVQTISDLTGGDEVEGGLIDVSPDTVEYFYEYVIGGAGAFVGRSANLVFETIPAIASGDFEGNLENRIPFVRKVIAQPSDRVDTQNYLEKRKELFTIFSRFDLARRRGDRESMQKLMARYDDEVRIFGRFKALDNARNRLLRQIKELERNLRIPEETRKKLIKLRRERIQEIMKKGIQLMRSVGIRKTA